MSSLLGSRSLGRSVWSSRDVDLPYFSWTSGATWRKRFIFLNNCGGEKTGGKRSKKKNAVFSTAAANRNELHLNWISSVAQSFMSWYKRMALCWRLVKPIKKNKTYT